MEPDDEHSDPRPPRHSVWAAMNADPQMRDDLRALRRGLTISLVLVALLVVVVLLARG